MASISSPSNSEATSASVPEGPVLNLMNKRLRALRKKHNRILLMESNLAQGKTLNKEQEEVLRSKPGVVALIDEYDKLRLPLAAAVQEEVALASSSSSSADADSAIDGLVALLYFGCLFDVKPQSEFTSMMLTRTHERGCCLTYDYVTDEATELLGEKDLDMISALGGLVTSRPLYSGISHRSALEGCVQHAKLWLLGAQKAIVSGSNVTYAGLREKLGKIMASDYYTTTPEMKAPVDVAAAVGKYNAACQMLVSEPGEQTLLDGESDAVQVDYHQLEDEEEDIQSAEVLSDQSGGSAYELLKDEADDSGHTAGDDTALQQDQQILENVEEHNQKNYEQEDQQYISWASNLNPRGERGGRRAYSNARGRNGRGGGGGGGYQNGRNQYYEPSYHQRSYYNTRGGRAGRHGDSAIYKPQGVSAHDNYDPQEF